MYKAIWVQWWTAANEVEPNADLGYWLGVYGCIAFVAVATLVLACWYVWPVIPRLLIILDIETDFILGI